MCRVVIILFFMSNWRRSVSSTYAYPTRCEDSFATGLIKCPPLSAARSISRRGVLMMTEVVGAAPFPWRTPWYGMREPFVSVVILESPNVVLTWCFMFCMLLNMQCTGGLSISSLSYAIQATEWTILSKHDFASLEHIAPGLLSCLIMSYVILLWMVWSIAHLPGLLPNCSLEYQSVTFGMLKCSFPEDFVVEVKVCFQ